jgi:hypothetical protein
MRIRSLALAAIFFSLSISSFGQGYGIQEFEIPGRNILKANLTSLLFRNYSFQYERVLSRRVSLGVSYRFMPSGPVPFKNAIINNVADGDPETIEQINSLTLSNSAITPELRFYFGKHGYGRGFYLAPFYRYAKHEAGNVTVEYQSSSTGTSSIDMSGKLTSNTGGLLIGAQWNLGRNLVLDWWIIGPHFGSGKGDLAGVSSRPLTASEQADLKNELESIDFPFGIESTVTVDANGAKMQLSGPMAGVRAGLQIGFRF